MAQKTKAQIQIQSDNTYLDNTTGAITPSSVRTLNNDWIDSIMFLDNSGSYTVGNAVSASFAANAGTASFFSGSISNAISSSYALSASYSVTSVSSSFASNALSASVAINANTASYVLNSISASFATSASRATSAATASYVLNAVSASYALSASFTTTASFALTASIARNLVIRARNGNNATLPVGTVVHITGASGDNPIFNTASFDTENLSSNTLGLLASSATAGQDVDVVVNGVVLGVDTDPASGYAAGDIIYLSSSGQFTRVQPQAPQQIVTLGQVLRAQQNNGSLYVAISNGWELDELHNVKISSVAYGDLLVNSGSLWINSKQLSGSYALTGSLNATSFTGSLQGTATSATTASFASTIASGLNITASNLLVNNSITASSISAQSASFGYVQTITGSAVIIGQEYVVLNTQIPAARYAGFKVYDSGSTNATASIVWDSVTNHWVYDVTSGSGYTGGGFLAGPKNSGSLAEITYPTLNRVLRSQGTDHVYDSNIIDDGTVKVQVNTEVTGTLNVTGNITGTLVGSASYASNANSASYALRATSASFSTTSTSASYASSSTSASYSVSATSASYALSTLSASYAATSSIATTSSYALSALSASFATTASFLSGSISSASFATSATSASYALTASFINALNQSVVITGSVNGNVTSASISSATSSLDFSLGNFFTSLVSGSTNFNITNPRRGQTVNLLVTTVGVATASFSSNVKQASGSRYTPTSGSSNDILTFVSWDGSSVYLANVKNLI